MNTKGDQMSHLDVIYDVNTKDKVTLFFNDVEIFNNSGQESNLCFNLSI